MDYCIAKIKDKIKLYEKTGKVVSTFFLTPIEINSLLSTLKTIPFCISGGYEEAERKIIIIGTDKDCIENFCSLVRIYSNKELSHRDVLGSVLGLGIKREMIGDIIISQNICDMIIMNEMKQYIINNLKTVGREKVSVECISFNEMQKVELKRKVRNISIASLRLDAVLSVTYGISRERSSNLINMEKVMINYVLCNNNSKSIKKDDLISVRGYGRIRILDILGETKKGRQRISVEIY